MDLVQSSHAGNFRLYRRTLEAKSNMQAQLRNAIMHDGHSVLRRERSNVKFTFTVKCIYEKALRPGVFTDPAAYFKTSPFATTRSTPIETILQDVWRYLGTNICIRTQRIWLDTTGNTRRGYAGMLMKLSFCSSNSCKLLIKTYSMRSSYKKFL